MTQSRQVLTVGYVPLALWMAVARDVAIIFAVIVFAVTQL